MNKSFGQTHSQQIIRQVMQALTKIRAYEAEHGNAVGKAHYEKLVQSIPNSPDVLIAAARQLASFHHYNTAQKLLSRVEGMADDNPDIKFMLGHAYFLIDQPDKALHFYEPLLQSDMVQAPLLTEIGIAHASLGNTAKARTCFSQAIEGDGAYVPAIHELVQIHTFTKDDKLLEKLEALQASKTQLRFDWAGRLAHAAGIAYGQLNRPDDAFSAFASVGQLIPAAPSFNEQAALDIHSKARAVCTPEDMNQAKPHNEEDARPIFIIGMPRSGTTLTEQILLGCPDTASIGEAPAMIETYNVWANGAFLSKGEASEINLFGAGCLQQAVQAYLSQIEGYRPGSLKQGRVIDKTPTNYVALGFIRAALPSARIIHCVRDPLDVCWSAFTTWFRTPTRWAYDLVDIGRFYGRYHQLMQYWQEILGDAIYTLSYESLVADSENEARRLVDYCGLEWNDRCLDLTKSRGSISTPSMTQARRPIYATSMKRYEPYLEHLGPLIDELHKAGVPLSGDL